MAKKRDEEGMRQRLLEAAREVFSRKSLMEITMSEISTEAGLAKGTIYLYFESKDELFIEMFRDCMATHREEVAVFLEAAAGLDEEAQLRRFLDFTLEATMGCSAMWGIWYQFLALAAAPRYREVVLEIARTHRQKRDEMIIALVRRGQASGVFRASLDAPLLVASLFALIDGLMLQVFTGSHADLPRLFHAAAEPVLSSMQVKETGR